MKNQRKQQIRNCLKSIRIDSYEMSAAIETDDLPGEEIFLECLSAQIDLLASLYEALQELRGK